MLSGNYFGMRLCARDEQTQPNRTCIFSTKSEFRHRVHDLSGILHGLDDLLVPKFTDRVKSNYF